MKYLVETISMYRMRYVVDTESAEWAMDDVTMNIDNDLKEFSQKHIAENITSVRELTDDEYMRLFDEDNDYLKSWSTEQKFSFVNKGELNES